MTSGVGHVTWIQSPLYSAELLPQLGVLRLGLLQDGDVGVRVLLKREKILVGGERPAVLAPIAYQFVAFQAKIFPHYRER
jgi:hypothetical protein